MLSASNGCSVIISKENLLKTNPIFVTGMNNKGCYKKLLAKGGYFGVIQVLGYVLLQISSILNYMIERTLTRPFLLKKKML